MDALVPLVYGELRALAHHQVARQRQGQTLDTTGLVHEAYLRLVDQTRAVFNDRQHFFRVAAMAMRQILVDQARRRIAAKRGGDVPHTPLHESRVGTENRAAEIVAVDVALEKLFKLNERLGRVVELRFFLGLSVKEASEMLGLDERTVKRDWRKARAFLFQELGRDREPPADAWTPGVFRYQLGDRALRCPRCVSDCVGTG